MGFYDNAYNNIGSMGLKGVAGVASLYTMGKQISTMKDVHMQSEINKMQSEINKIDTASKINEYVKDAGDRIADSVSNVDKITDSARLKYTDLWIAKSNMDPAESAKAMDDLRINWTRGITQEQNSLLIANANLNKAQVLRDYLGKKADDFVPYSNDDINALKQSKLDAEEHIADTSLRGYKY